MITENILKDRPSDEFINFAIRQELQLMICREIYKILMEANDEN